MERLKKLKGSERRPCDRAEIGSRWKDQIHGVRPNFRPDGGLVALGHISRNSEGQTRQQHSPSIPIFGLTVDWLEEAFMETKTPALEGDEAVLHSTPGGDLGGI